MHRFGRSRLLNQAIPHVRLPKWSWLLKTQSFLPDNKKSTRAKDAVLARAKRFFTCMQAHSLSRKKYARCMTPKNFVTLA